MTLKEICPQVEAALPSDYLPEADQLKTFAGALQALSLGGDLEAQNAIPLLLQPTEDYYEVVTTGKQHGAAALDKLFAADQEFLRGIDAFAKRCKAVGSSALQ